VKRLGFLTALTGAVLLLIAGSASASSPWWHLTSGTSPANLPPGGEGLIVVQAANLGDADADGASAPLSIADTLPAGLKALSVEAVAGVPGAANRGPVNCSLKLKPLITCGFEGTLPPYDLIEVVIRVRIEESASSGELNEAGVSGGEAPGASVSRPIAVSGEPTPFGIEAYELAPEEEGGTLDTQAGSHPFQVTGSVTLNQAAGAQPVALAKDVDAELPPGLLGNPTPLPRCALAQFLALNSAFTDLCTPQTAVGVAMIGIGKTGLADRETFTVPIFNLEPAFGEPARFGILLPFTPLVLDTSVRSDGDYGVTLGSHNISQTGGLLKSQLVFWGTPGDPRHDNSRGWECLAAARAEVGDCEPLQAQLPPPFLTLPTSCTGPLQTSILADSWTQPASRLSFSSTPTPALDGCNRVPFVPTIAAEPTANSATSPTGFNFDLNVDDEDLANPKGFSASDIEKAVVTLPEGFTSNPSVAAGLKACSEAEYKASTVELSTGCTEESKIGSVEIESPLVSQKLTGSLYVAEQVKNPFHNLLTLYMVIRNPEIGVIVKAAGKVEPNPVTGQLVTTFGEPGHELPQLPFSHFHLSFRQGQRSPLITPPTCGTYTVKADLYPYSNPAVPLPEESSFQITQGPEGNPCPSGGVPPFHPGLQAGTLNNNAGSYSPFYVHITRRDSEQEITHFSIKLPPGVIGKLAGVGQCSDAQIAAAKAREREGGGAEEQASPSCPANAEVGHSLVGAGVGNVLAYAPGRLYLAGPYHGSNLSLVSITAAKVGPFDLGTVVVRFALRINPETAEVFVDATGSDPIPHIVDGIPVHLRDIRAYVDKPEFILNPTSCEPTSTASTILGSGLNFASEADDQPVVASSPFQVASCASLPFNPRLKLSLKGSMKRTGTPAFTARLTMKPGEANVAKAAVTLPPTELLDNAHIGTSCTRAQFNQGAVPGEDCPKESIYGSARAITPILGEALEGSVYLRSNGGERNIPDLVAALHSKEIDINLVGFVDSVRHKRPGGEVVGRLRNRFEMVPDAPVSSFTLELDGGNKGLLENRTNLCRGTHRSTIDFSAHSGKVSDTEPPIAVDCGRGKGKGKHHRRARP
jgi:hypothetical protein